MWILDILLAWAGTSLAIVSASSSRAEIWCRVGLVGGSSASRDHLDLLFASVHWPILASCANDFDLFEQISLIPAKLDLGDLAILVEVDEVWLR